VNTACTDVVVDVVDVVAIVVVATVVVELLGLLEVSLVHAKANRATETASDTAAPNRIVCFIRDRSSTKRVAPHNTIFTAFFE